MIVWTIGSGESGCTDTLHRAADAAATAAAGWLDATTPTWGMPAAAAVTVRVDACETHLAPAYDRRGRYDPDATHRAAHQLRDTITGAPASVHGAALPGTVL